MTIAKLIPEAERRRRRGAFTGEEYYCMINNLEKELYNNLLCGYIGAELPKAHTTDSEALILPEEYCDLYIYYILGRIDFESADMTRFNNDMAMYNTIYRAFSDYYNRTHTPKQNNSIGGA